MKKLRPFIFIRELLRLLQQPYPYYYNKGLFYPVLSLLLLAFCFNFFLTPFDVYPPEHKWSYIMICLIHAIVPSVICFVYLWGSNYLLQADEQTWTIGKEALLLLWMLLLIGVGNFLIRDFIYDNPDNWSWRYLAEEIKNTFLAGAFLMAIQIPWNYVRLSRQYATPPPLRSNTKPLPSTTPFNSIKVLVYTQIPSENFELDLQDFLFARADGNYTEIYLQSSANGKALIKRILLKEFANQLAEYPFVYRPHRSWLVHLEHISHIEGNAQGYLLSFPGQSKKVPVARGQIEIFKTLLQQD